MRFEQFHFLFLTNNLDFLEAHWLHKVITNFSIHKLLRGKKKISANQRI